MLVEILDLFLLGNMVEVKSRPVCLRQVTQRSALTLPQPLFSARLLLFGCTLCADLNAAYLGALLRDCAELWAQSWRRRGGNEQPDQFHHRVRGARGNMRNGKCN